MSCAGRGGRGRAVHLSGSGSLLGGRPAAMAASPRKPSPTCSDCIADGDAPGCRGDSRTRSVRGRIRKRTGGSSAIASPSTPTGTGLADTTSNSALDHCCSSDLAGCPGPFLPRVGTTATPRRPASMRGRVPEPTAWPSRYGLLDTRIVAAEVRGAVGGGAAQVERGVRGPERHGHGVEQGADLRVAVALVLHRFGVEAHRDVVDEHPAVHLAEVD